MEFKEYKNAAYWQNIRNDRKEDSASAKDVAAIILGFVALFVSLWLV